MGVGYTWEPRLCLLKLRGELPPGGHAQPEGLRGAPGKREGRTQGQGDRKSLGSGEHRRMRVCVCVTCPQASVDIVSVGIASVGTVPLAHQQWADLGRPLLPGAALQACTCRAHAGGRQPGSATCHLTAKTLTCVPLKTLWPQSCRHLSGHSQSKSCRNRRNSEIRLEREKINTKKPEEECGKRRRERGRRNGKGRRQTGGSRGLAFLPSSPEVQLQELKKFSC